MWYIEGISKVGFVLLDRIQTPIVIEVSRLVHSERESRYNALMHLFAGHSRKVHN